MGRESAAGDRRRRGFIYDLRFLIVGELNPDIGSPVPGPRPKIPDKDIPGQAMLGAGKVATLGNLPHSTPST